MTKAIQTTSPTRSTSRFNPPMARRHPPGCRSSCQAPLARRRRGRRQGRRSRGVPPRSFAATSSAGKGASRYCDGRGPWSLCTMMQAFPVRNIGIRCGLCFLHLGVPARRRAVVNRAGCRRRSCTWSRPWRASIPNAGAGAMSHGVLSLDGLPITARSDTGPSHRSGTPARRAMSLRPKIPPWRLVR